MIALSPTRFLLPLLLAIFGSLSLQACSSCESNETKKLSETETQTAAPHAADGDKETSEIMVDEAGRPVQVEVKMLQHGDKTSPVVIRSYPGITEAKKERSVKYPPDAYPYVTILDDKEALVVRFPEYQTPRKMSANGYGVLDKISKKALLIDPGIGNVRMMRFWLTHVEASLAIIAVTHGHLDHTGGVLRLWEFYPDAVFLAGEADAAWMTKPQAEPLNAIEASLPPSPTKALEDGELLEFGEIRLIALHTPGHTVGSLAFHYPKKKLLFSGDTLFLGNIGRTDLPHALTKLEEIASIKEKLLILPEATRVLPGHGTATTIGREKRENNFLIHKKP